MKHVSQTWHVSSRHQEPNAQCQRQPYPRIARDFIAQQTRRRMTHVEDMPKLGKGQGQERDGHRRMLIEPEPDTGQGERAECRGGERDAVEDDREPLPATENRLFWIARRAFQDAPFALAHGQRKGWETRPLPGSGTGFAGAAAEAEVRTGSQDLRLTLRSGCRTADRSRTGEYCRR